jgi:hypothetical protein
MDAVQSIAKSSNAKIISNRNDLSTDHQNENSRGRAVEPDSDVYPPPPSLMSKEKTADPTPSQRPCPSITAGDKKLLPSFDVCIIEHGVPCGELTYLIGFILSAKIPLLYLFPKYHPKNHYTEFLRHMESRKAFVRLCQYEERTLPKLLSRYFRELLGGAYEKPCVKYTLRFPLSVHEYLSWKRRHSDGSIARWIRRLISQEIQRDEPYQIDLKRKKKDE